MYPSITINIHISKRYDRRPLPQRSLLEVSDENLNKSKFKKGRYPQHVYMLYCFDNGLFLDFYTNTIQ